MPDSFDKWTPDPTFWDDAWADMQQRLDQEQEPRRRAFAFWTWAAYGMFYGLVVILLTALIYTAQTKSDTSSATAHETVASDDQQSTSSSELITNLPLETTEIPASSSVASTNIDQTLNDRAAITELNVTPASPTILSVANERTAPAIAGPQTLNTTNSPEPTELALVLPVNTDDVRVDLIAIDQPIDVTATNTAVSLLNTSILPLSIAEGTHPNPTPQSLNSKFHGLNTAAQFSTKLYVSHGSHNPGLGYGAGLAWQLPVSDRWAIGAELLVRQEQLPLRLGGSDNNEDALVDPVLVPPGTNNDIEELSNLLESENLDFVTVSTVGLETKVAYRLGRRWQASAGVGLHYILGGQGPRLNGFQSESNRAISSFFSNELEQVGEDLLSAVGIPTGAGGGQTTELVNVNRLQLESRLGINYQLTPRWSIGADTRFRMTNVYDTSNLNLGRLRGQLSLSYRF